MTPPDRAPACDDDRHIRNHFDSIADHYDEELPEHFQQYLLERKMSFITKVIPNLKGKRGLDVGCGIGKYCEFLTVNDASLIVGVDLSRQNIKNSLCRTSKVLHTFSTSATDIPFRSNYFDFTYCINMLHHITSRELQERAVQEMLRVVKPGGLVFIFDLSMSNPVFAFYLNHLFHRIRKIDDGTELFLSPRDVGKYIGKNARVIGVEYYSFMPDLVPKRLINSAIKLEQFLEKTPLRKMAMHEVILLQKK
ncbi:MAG: class I SAM-dependent methyltransferase [Promethearchaeota archaeon]